MVQGADRSLRVLMTPSLEQDFATVRASLGAWQVSEAGAALDRIAAICKEADAIRSTHLHVWIERANKAEARLAKEKLLHPRSDGEWAELTNLCERQRKALEQIANEPPPQAWADAVEIARAALASEGDSS